MRNLRCRFRTMNDSLKARPEFFLGVTVGSVGVCVWLSVMMVVLPTLEAAHMHELVRFGLGTLLIVVTMAFANAIGAVCALWLWTYLCKNPKARARYPEWTPC